MTFAAAIPRRPARRLPPAGASVVLPGLVALAVAAAGLFTGGRRRAGTADEGFAGTVLPHLDAAYSLARFLARDPDAAEDIVQDAMLKAFRGYAGFRGGDAKAWLLAIVRRQFLDWAAARRAGGAVFAAADLEDAAPACEADGPEQALLRQGDVGAVRRAIEALPEPFRACIVLREIEELSYREVADVMAVPIGTVMSRLARARALLVERLKGETGA